MYLSVKCTLCEKIQNMKMFQIERVLNTAGFQYVRVTQDFKYATTLLNLSK